MLREPRLKEVKRSCEVYEQELWLLGSKSYTGPTTFWSVCSNSNPTSGSESVAVLHRADVILRQGQSIGPNWKWATQSEQLTSGLETVCMPKILDLASQATLGFWEF